MDGYRTIPGTNRTPGQFPTVIILLSDSEKMKGHLKQLRCSRCNQHFDNLLFFKRENHKLFHNNSSLILSANFLLEMSKMFQVEMPEGKKYFFNFFFVKFLDHEYFILDQEHVRCQFVLLNRV